ncbi:MAG: hypothetical protein IJW97_08030 [Clostridia bacterium]|nr:hypothetical protein [Clostridia bacterium]
MNITEFNEELQSINVGSWGYGNEILYCMTRDPRDLTDKDKLTGAIWLIGRAYAASPQRRSYGGTMENTVGYIDTAGKTPERCPVWPVRTQNDGREGFFDEIADKLKALIEADAAFQAMISNYAEHPTPYRYDRSDADVEALAESIRIVLRYNIFLSQALESFDHVPAGNCFNGNRIYCSNHISFSSKFLHFYFPHRVFIIDTFARDGGKSLFNGNAADEHRHRAFYDAPPLATDVFGDDVYAQFSKIEAKRIYGTVAAFPDVHRICEIYDSRSRGSVALSNDNLTVKDYIEHCIRSYLLGCYLTHTARIQPINQIKYAAAPSISSMPRLTDAIFLNIKSPLSDALTNHYRSIKDGYHVGYITL